MLLGGTEKKPLNQCVTGGLSRASKVVIYFSLIPKLWQIFLIDTKNTLTEASEEALGFQ